jgi:hypothetical protein
MNTFKTWAAAAALVFGAMSVVGIIASNLPPAALATSKPVAASSAPSPCAGIDLLACQKLGEEAAKQATTAAPAGGAYLGHLSDEHDKEKQIAFQKLSATLSESTKQCFDKAYNEHKESFNNVYSMLQAAGEKHDYDTMTRLVDTALIKVHQQCRPTVSDKIIEMYLDGLRLTTARTVQ